MIQPRNPSLWKAAKGCCMGAWTFESVGYDRHFKYLKRLTVLVPPMELQVRFGHLVGSVSDLSRQLGSEEAELADLFASLQQKAFQGAL